MLNINRYIGLYFRRRSEQRRIGDAVRMFDEWSVSIEQLPKNICIKKKLAIVRLDDIGDYLLWHNFISFYKSSKRYSDYNITLIGNHVWKNIFEEYDTESVDNTIWVDKQQYLNDAEYRMQLWQHIRNENFETIICPTRTRPLHIDDSIVLSAGAINRIASENSFQFGSLNTKSDAHYTQLFSYKNEIHELYFNRNFAAFATGENIEISRPTIPILESRNKESKQIICFIGAAAKSKTWDVNYWIDLVKLLQQNGYDSLLSGGKNEKEIADKIVAATQTKSIVGQTNLVETINAIANAKAVITGDTMAAHAAISLAKPTIILANGVNSKRFVAYEEAGFLKVKTIYTQQYLHSKKESFYSAVSKDMRSIKPSEVFATLQKLV